MQLGKDRYLGRARTTKMSDEDEWYDSDDTVDRLLGLLDDADKTPVERLQEEVQEQRTATTSAYRRVEELNEQLKAATAEFQRQQQLLNSKQRELAAAQQAAVTPAAATPATPQQATPQQYIAALRKSRQGMTFNQWQIDATKNKERFVFILFYKFSQYHFTASFKPCCNENSVV